MNKKLLNYMAIFLLGFLLRHLLQSSVESFVSHLSGSGNSLVLSETDTIDLIQIGLNVTDPLYKTDLMNMLVSMRQIPPTLYPDRLISDIVDVDDKIGRYLAQFRDGSASKQKIVNILANDTDGILTYFTKNIDMLNNNGIQTFILAPKTKKELMDAIKFLFMIASPDMKARLFSEIINLAGSRNIAMKNAGDQRRYEQESDSDQRRYEQEDGSDQRRYEQEERRAEQRRIDQRRTEQESAESKARRAAKRKEDVIKSNEARIAKNMEQREARNVANAARKEERRLFADAEEEEEDIRQAEASAVYKEENVLAQKSKLKVTTKNGDRYYDPMKSRSVSGLVQVSNLTIPEGYSVTIIDGMDPPAYTKEFSAISGNKNVRLIPRHTGSLTIERIVEGFYGFR
jgi:hypothetical protein